MHLKGKTGVLQKLAFEVRYQFGFAYLDKCGRILNAITQQPEWVIKGEGPNPQATTLVSLRTGTSFSFSAYNLAFGLEMPTGGDALSKDDVEGFIDQVDLLSRTTIDYLGVSEFTRIGLRTWYLFECAGKKDSVSWLNSLGYYSVSESLISAFGEDIEAASITYVLISTDRKFRLSFSTVERQAQLDLGEEILHVRASTLSKDQNKVLMKQIQTKRRMHSNPEFAALIDVDSYQENPVLIDPRDFIDTSIKDYSDRFAKANRQ